MMINDGNLERILFGLTGTKVTGRYSRALLNGHDAAVERSSLDESQGREEENGEGRE